MESHHIPKQLVDCTRSIGCPLEGSTRLIKEGNGSKGPNIVHYDDNDDIYVNFISQINIYRRDNNGFAYCCIEQCETDRVQLLFYRPVNQNKLKTNCTENPARLNYVNRRYQH
jgi:hypothetical protein